MSAGYKAVSWNRQKKLYDAVLLSGVALYLALFVGLGAIVHPHATAETLLIRGFGTAAFLLLHIALCIGPLCRLDSRFLPLLYNRRHLGVTTFILGLCHGTLALFQFHALGNLDPLVSLFTSNTRFVSVPDFPFQALGFLALVILFLMAATSHDFWLHNLSAPVWKRLHMLVYWAWGLLVAHVALGVLQSERSPIMVGAVTAGLVVVLGLHAAAALKERGIDRAKIPASSEYVEICAVERIPEDRAVIASVAGERVAIFRYDGKVSAISNVCQHQNGPLGEGRIVDGCITCPWHGYQYLPETGVSPPPFKEKVPTFCTRIENGRVFVKAAPNAAGTRVEPSSVAESAEPARA
jgi:nitrite reductase/ring-hydroxylating ferredoxin subunit/DMSO/TMAO reductase YedYZ heme-binding membrane subunit